MKQAQTIVSSDGSNVSMLADRVKGAKAQVIFAHGAGANMSHEFMDRITLLLNNQDINVIRFNFPYMDKRALLGKKYPPDRMPVLLACYQEVIDEVVKQKDNELPLFIGGKSMGSRAAATLLSEPEALETFLYNKVKGVFCLGYPFHPAKKPEKLRLEPLLNARKPVLIVQGERDTLGSKAEVMTFGLPEQCQCEFLEDGDHSLKPRVKSGFTYSEHMVRAANTIVKFINNHSDENK